MRPLRVVAGSCRSHYNHRPTQAGQLCRNSDGSPSSATSIIVGLDISNFTFDTQVPAGVVHWGGVPSGSYVGEL
jgi:hypothetical protein